METIKHVMHTVGEKITHTSEMAKVGGEKLVGADVMTTEFGAPVPEAKFSQTAGVRGPVLLQDTVLIEKNANFNREKIVERTVHAAGVGAQGYFQVTNPDIVRYTKANFLKPGQRTDTFVRFSLATKEKEFPDSARDVRGFAIKFYTSEGNYDLVANSTPLFFVRDPALFPDFMHCFARRHSKTDLTDFNSQWDFLSRNPESIHQILYHFGDRGTPAGYRFINGYGTHTFLWYNDAGEKFWVKYHIKSDVGVKNFELEESIALNGRDPDYQKRDLINFIEKGNEATWTMHVQIMPFEDAWKYKYDPFDVTKVWLHSDYPLIEVGKLVLNKIPDNFFQDVEQAAFSPANFVPGITHSPDPMLQARLFAYTDAQRYRLGVNYHTLPVNAPLHASKHGFARDGLLRADGNGDPTYLKYTPNYMNHPHTDPSKKAPELEVHGKAGFHGETLNKVEDEIYDQPRKLWFKVFDDKMRANFVKNVCDWMKDCMPQVIARQCAIFSKVDPELGSIVAKRVGGITAEMLTSAMRELSMK